MPEGPGLGAIVYGPTLHHLCVTEASVNRPTPATCRQRAAEASIRKIPFSPRLRSNESLVSSPYGHEWRLCILYLPITKPHRVGWPTLKGTTVHLGIQVEGGQSVLQAGDGDDVLYSLRLLQVPLNSLSLPVPKTSAPLRDLPHHRMLNSAPLRLFAFRPASVEPATLWFWTPASRLNCP